MKRIESDARVRKTRALIRKSAALWHSRDQRQDADVLEALATLLTAYALGSQSAAAALTQPSEDGRQWRLPPRASALDMAADVNRLALELRAMAGSIAGQGES